MQTVKILLVGTGIPMKIYSQGFQKGGYIDRCLMCIYACVSTQDLGRLGACFHRRFHPLRLLLSPYWDSSRAVVDTWLTEYCIQFWLHFISMYLWTYAKPGDIEFQGTLKFMSKGRASS